VINVGQRDTSFLAWLDKHVSVAALFGSAYDSEAFDVLCKEYLELAAVRDRLSRLGEVLSRMPGWGDQLEAALQEELETVRNRLYELASDIAQSGAGKIEQIQARSAVLSDLFEADRDDLISNLTAALCRDLYLMSNGSKVPNSE
jgi:hypothetical protein